MNVSAPKVTTIAVSAIFVLIGILANYVTAFSAITPYAIWVIVLGYVILLIGTLIEGM